MSMVSPRLPCNCRRHGNTGFMGAGQLNFGNIPQIIRSMLAIAPQKCYTKMTRIRGERHRRRLLLFMTVTASCMLGIMIGVYTDVVAIASTIKRLAGNQVMTIYYHTSALPDRTPRIVRNLSMPLNSIISTQREVDNDQLDVIANNIQYRRYKPLLTLFTTFKNDANRDRIHKNVLYNWASFRPHVIPVLFDTDTDPALIFLAKQLGWEVVPLSNRSSFDVPYLKPMFHIAKNNYNSTFYGYSNGDIMYDSGLVNTLNTCMKALHELQQTLILGQRYNIVSDNKPLFRPGDVLKAAKQSGQLFRTDAEDYFILGDGEFLWDEVPDVVVGRPGYDNFLAGLAVQKGVSVVDATATLTALHQSGEDGNLAGFINKDNAYNYEKIGIFNYDRGLTSNAPYATHINTSTGAIYILERR